MCAAAARCRHWEAAVPNALDWRICPRISRRASPLLRCQRVHKQPFTLLGFFGNDNESIYSSVSFSRI